MDERNVDEDGDEDELKHESEISLQEVEEKKELEPNLIDDIWTGDDDLELKPGKKDLEVDNDDDINVKLILGQSKIDELEEVYKTSKTKCFKQCQAMGLNGQLIDQLLSEFEQNE